MRRTALLRRSPKQIVAQPVALPAPVGGWDGISPLANMPVDRAYQLDNWVCRPGWIEPRKGSIAHATDLGGGNVPVQTVMAYNGFAKNYLFGVAGGVIYDCTNAGDAVPTIVDSLQSSRLQYVMFSNPAEKQFLYTVNGTDSPWIFDSTTWTQPAYTGYGGVDGFLLQAFNVSSGDVLSFAPTANSQMNTSADTASGSVLTFTATSGLSPGEYALGANIPPDTKILSLTSTQVTLSANVTADVPEGSIITFFSGPSTSEVEVGNFAVALGIPANAMVAAVSPTTVTLSAPITSEILANSQIQFNPSAAQEGFDPTTFVQVNAYAGYLWFVQANSTSAVYLASVGAVQGPASLFPLGQYMRYGGYLQAIGTWTVDTRQSVDEYIAFITSRGEVIVYQGTNPSVASSWNQVGVYKIGTPIGRRCFLRIAGDLQIITVDGIVGMSEMLSTDRAAANRVSLTSIILNPTAQAAQLYRHNFGWQLIEYALGTLAILNIPIQENNQQMQFVMNTITGAWSRFIGLDPNGSQNPMYGLNANCWEVDASDNVYFGGNDGTVYQWNVGAGDGNRSITCICGSAYNGFGNAAQVKNVQSIQPLITTTGNPVASIGLNFDFQQAAVLSTEEPYSSGIPLWGKVKWGEFDWGNAPSTTDNWLGGQGIGHYASIVTKITTTPNANNPTSAPVVQLNGWNILAQPGAFV